MLCQHIRIGHVGYLYINKSLYFLFYINDVSNNYKASVISELTNMHKKIYL